MNAQLRARDMGLPAHDQRLDYGRGNDNECSSNASTGCDVDCSEIRIDIREEACIRKFYEPVLTCLGYHQSSAYPGLSRWVSDSRRTTLLLNETAASADLGLQVAAPNPSTKRLVFKADSAERIDALHEVLLAIGANILVPPSRYATGFGDAGLVCSDGNGVLIDLHYQGPVQVATAHR